MGVSLKQLRAEYDAVAARYKDTPQWMKAPNGEPTNLTERQWVLVRTPRFKAFFGNWEMQRDKELPVIEVADRMFGGDRKTAQKWLADKKTQSSARMTMPRPECRSPFLPMCCEGKARVARHRTKAEAIQEPQKSSKGGLLTITKCCDSFLRC